MQQNHRTNKRKEPKSFVTEFNPDMQCIVLKIIDVEGLSPFFLMEHPKGGIYRVNLRENGLHVTR